MVHCPICGKPPFAVAGPGATWELDPCAHVAFIFASEVGEFIYQSPACEQRCEAALAAMDDADESDAPYLERILDGANYDNKLLAIEITYGGMACGPVWATDVYGFDYATLSSDA